MEDEQELSYQEYAYKRSRFRNLSISIGWIAIASINISAYKYIGAWGLLATFFSLFFISALNEDMF